MQVEIGNYDSFYEKGIVFSPEQVLRLTKSGVKCQVPISQSNLSNALITLLVVCF